MSPFTFIAALVGCYFLAAFTVSIYLHRFVAHRSFELRRAPEFGFLLLSIFLVGINPLRWASVHRQHHAFADKEGDPHSPLIKGYWKVQLFGFWYSIIGARKKGIVEAYGRDLRLNPLYSVIDRLDPLLTPLTFATQYLVAAIAFGWLWGLAFFACYYALLIFGQNFVNAATHIIGYRNYENTPGTNLNGVVAALTVGESLHNNHHGRPSSARFSLRRGEIDPSWWAIRALCALHLARVDRDRVKRQRSLPAESAAG